MAARLVLVTIRLPRNADHDPHNKVTGPCPVNDSQPCTDITGEHHTIAVWVTPEQTVTEIKSRISAGALSRWSSARLTRVEMTDHITQEL